MCFIYTHNSSSITDCVQKNVLQSAKTPFVYNTKLGHIRTRFIVIIFSFVFHYLALVALAYPSVRSVGLSFHIIHFSFTRSSSYSSSSSSSTSIPESAFFCLFFHFFSFIPWDCLTSNPSRLNMKRMKLSKQIYNTITSLTVREFKWHTQSSFTFNVESKRREEITTGRVCLQSMWLFSSLLLFFLTVSMYVFPCTACTQTSLLA